MVCWVYVCDIFVGVACTALFRGFVGEPMLWFRAVIVLSAWDVCLCLACVTQVALGLVVL